MTLILTEASSFGIAMATDSALSTTNPRRNATSVIPDAVIKLQKIPYLNAGVSCWGLGMIGGTRTDNWLSNFITSHTSVTSLHDFALALAAQLNLDVGANHTGTGRLGFHLAGFVNYNDAMIPSFYHIHDGPSTELAGRGTQVDPSRFNANHDLPPDRFQTFANNGQAYITRNGNYYLYAQIIHLLGTFFEGLFSQGIIIPHSQNLFARVDYLVFQIRTMSEIYRLSNLVPGIGDPIRYLTIDQTGFRDEGIRY